jgi:hypothetical protein
VRGRLLGTIRVDTEKFEGALLDRGWPGVKGEEVFLVEGGGGLDAAIGPEVGEEGLEAVHRQTVRGASGGCAFEDLAAYRRFVDEVVGRRNARNRKRIEIERAALKPLPNKRPKSIATLPLACPAGDRPRSGKEPTITAEVDAVAIVSYDEKPGIQAIATTAPNLSPEPGLHATFARDHEYKRNGTVSLLAGIDLLTGKVHALVRDRR